MARWIDALDLPQYEVSDNGNIRNKKTGRILKQFPSTGGYMQLMLRQNKQNKTVRVNRLVAESFYCEYRPGLDVDHLDGNKKNNRLDNLDFCTRKENIRRAFESGLRVPPRQIKFEIVETGEVFNSIHECQRVTRMDRAPISKCLSGELESYKGLHFRKI